jgi:hypothetical protein
MDDFFIQNLDEILQMDEQINKKIKMLASLDWC